MAEIGDQIYLDALFVGFRYLSNHKLLSIGLRPEGAIGQRATGWHKTHGVYA